MKLINKNILIYLIMNFINNMKYVNNVEIIIIDTFEFKIYKI